MPSSEATIDWPGLLKWSLQYTDGTNNASPRTAEDIEFLQNALQEYFGAHKDPTEAVKECKPLLTSENEHEVLSSISVLDEAVDLEPELARNLHKLELIEPLHHCLRSSNMTIKEETAKILGFALPNNEHVQKAFFDAGLLQTVMNELLAHKEYALGSDDDKVRYYNSLLSVLAGLVKHLPPAERAFMIDFKGKEFLKDLDTPATAPRIRTKIENFNQHIEYVERARATTGSMASDAAPLALGP